MTDRNNGLNELTDRRRCGAGNGAGHGECAPRGRVLGWSLAPLTELLYDKGGLVSNKHDAPPAPSALAADAVAVAVEAVRVRRQDAKAAIGDVAAVEVGRRRRDTHVGV